MPTEHYLNARGSKEIDPMLKVESGSGMQRSRAENRMMEVRNHPGWMRLAELLLHPVKFGAIFQVSRPCRAGFRVLRAVQAKELRQLSICERVVPRGLSVGKRRVIQKRRQIALSFGFISIVVA